jgi:hypothetical protein
MPRKLLQTGRRGWLVHCATQLVAGCRLACLITYRHRQDGFCEVIVEKEPHLLHAHGVSPAVTPGNDRADIKFTEPDGSRPVYPEITITALTLGHDVAGDALQNEYSADKARGRKIARYRYRCPFFLWLKPRLKRKPP